MTGGLSLLAGAAAIGTGYAVKHYGPSVWHWASKQVGGFESSIEHLGDDVPDAEILRLR